MGKILFVDVRSPSEKDPVEFMKTVAGGSDMGLLLFEDGVLYTQVAKWKDRMLGEGIKLYAAKDDLEARGFSLEGDGFEVLDYPDIAELIMERYDKVVNV